MKGYSRVAGHTKKRNNNSLFLAENSAEFTSASARKLKNKGSFGATISAAFSYCIIEFVSAFAAIAKNVVCKECHGKVTFSQSDKRGAGFKLTMRCDNCDDKSVSNCPQISSAYEVKRRLVFIFRLLDVGSEGLNKFLGLMDICGGIAIGTYYMWLDNVEVAARSVYNIVLRIAVNEDKELNSSHGNVAEDLTVLGDGFWKKWGFTSLFGVATIIGGYSGKVLDAIVKSSFCQLCSNQKIVMDKNYDDFQEWYGDHEEDCSINHAGSAGRMEIEAIVSMFQASQPKHGVKYVRYIGDGHSKTFKGILDSRPYGDEVIVKKRVLRSRGEAYVVTTTKNEKRK